jgi:hypothetical protein
MEENNLIKSKIHLIRGELVMLDSDLAQLYGVETKNLKRQVRRNAIRFPEDFMFELTAEEYTSLRCQNGTLKTGRTGCARCKQVIIYTFRKTLCLYRKYSRSQQTAM